MIDPTTGLVDHATCKGLHTYLRNGHWTNCTAKHMCEPCTSRCYTVDDRGLLVGSFPTLAEAEAEAIRYLQGYMGSTDTLVRFGASLGPVSYRVSTGYELTDDRIEIHFPVK